jgi:hypothetical protein
VACGARTGQARTDLLARLLRGSAAGKSRSAPPAAPAASAATLRLPSPRFAAALILVMLGFGCLAGAAAGPDASPSLAASTPVTVVEAAPPAAPVAPAPEPSSPPESAPAAAPVHASATPEPAPAPTEPASPAPAAHSPSPASKHQSSTGDDQGSAPSLPPITRVAIIALGPQAYDRAFAPDSPAPFLAHDLVARGALLSEYRAVADGDAANGIAMVSGQPPNPQTEQGCATYDDFVDGEGCVYPPSVESLPIQLAGVGRTWRAYVEDMANGPPGEAQACRHPALGATDTTGTPRPGDAYATARNPFVYFHGIVDAPDCPDRDVPLTALDADLASPDDLPSLLWIVPNLCHDGRDQPCPDGSPGGLPAADGFLRTWVPKLLDSPGFRDGLLVVTSDAGTSPDRRVGAVLVSRFIKPGTISTKRYDHYSLLRTLEDLYSLPHLGRAARATVKAFGDDVFTLR